MDLMFAQLHEGRDHGFDVFHSLDFTTSQPEIILFTSLSS
jgi:hypothetical protein